MPPRLPRPTPTLDLGVRFWYDATVTGLLIRTVESRVEHISAPEPLACHVSVEIGRAGHADGIEARPLRVGTYTPARRNLALTRRYSPPADTLDTELVWAAMESHVGVLYDFPGLLLALCYCVRPASFWGSHIAFLHCSELTTKALRVGGCEPFPQDRRDAADVTPAALEAALLRLGWARESDRSG